MMNNRDLVDRARHAGLSMRWRDAAGQIHRVSNESVRRLLAVLEGHDAPVAAGLPPMIVTVMGQLTPLTLPDGMQAGDFRLETETGEVVEGPLRRIRGAGPAAVPVVRVSPPVDRAACHHPCGGAARLSHH
ncbi:hypothetical protein [Komagataeibacter intermedius]|uniref:hypothetical protein n=1 Tax=Komagataeibacter intermedius TaxID=66229 RepID=UPI003B430486